MQRRSLRAVALAVGVGVLALSFLREQLVARSADDARSKHETVLEREKIMPPPRPAPAVDSLFAATPKAMPESNTGHDLARPIRGESAAAQASGGATHVADPRALTSRSRLMTELELYPQERALVSD